MWIANVVNESCRLLSDACKSLKPIGQRLPHFGPIHLATLLSTLDFFRGKAVPTPACQDVGGWGEHQTPGASSAWQKVDSARDPTMQLTPVS